MELDEVKDLVKSLGDARTSLEKQQKELVEANRMARDAAEKAEKMNADHTANIDKALAAANETGTQVRELAQKLDDLSKTMRKSVEGPVTLRQSLTKIIDDQKTVYESFAKRDTKSFRMKAIATANVAGLLPNPYVDTLVAMERQPLRIRDLLTSVPVTTDSVRYGQQNVRTNAAAIVAEGSAKPYSTYAWQNQTATIETVAHLAKLTLQAIADAPRLVAEVEAELRYGLALAEENELLNGDGTTGHLSGLRHNATAYAIPAGANGANILTPIDQLRIAMLQIHLAFAAPDAHILSPVDVANMELIRRDLTGKTGGYLFSDNFGGAPGPQPLSLWRLPVVESASMPVSKFMTGAFKYASSLYTREGVEVLISTENDTDFENNQATMRCEERLGLAVRRPYALVQGSFGAGS